MHAQSHHSCEKIKGRSDMHHAALHRPRTKARSLPLLPHTDRSVLMPRKRPVVLRQFVKKDCPHGSCTSSKNLRGKQADAAGADEQRQEYLEAVKPHASLPLRNGRQCNVQITQARLNSTPEKLRAVSDEVSRRGVVHATSYSRPSATVKEYPARGRCCPTS